MYLSDLIRQLQDEYREHGDVEVIGYTMQPEAEFEATAVEYNIDSTGPVVLIEMEPRRS